MSAAFCSNSRSAVLHDDKPPVAVLQLHHSSLMQSVGRIGNAVVHDEMVLIRSVDIIRAQTDLPTFRAACRTGDIVFAVYLVGVRSFHAKASSQLMSVFESAGPYLARFGFHGSGIGGQLGDIQSALAMHDKDTSVVIEKQSGVVHIFGENHTLPRPFGTVGNTHAEVSFFASPSVRRAESHIVFAVMIAHTGCPRTVQIKVSSLHIITGIFIITVHGIPDHFPIYQIFGMQNRTSRHIVHAGGHHIKIISHTDYIGIRPVSPKQRIGKGAVAVIRIPHILLSLYGRLNQSQAGQQKHRFQYSSFHSLLTAIQIK